MIELAVYDLCGRVIRGLLHEKQSPGTHTIQWNGLADNGQEVTNGVYFIILKSAHNSTSGMIATRTVFIR